MSMSIRVKDEFVPMILALGLRTLREREVYRELSYEEWELTGDSFIVVAVEQYQVCIFRDWLDGREYWLEFSNYDGGWWLDASSGTVFDFCYWLSSCYVDGNFIDPNEVLIFIEDVKWDRNGWIDLEVPEAVTSYGDDLFDKDMNPIESDHGTDIGFTDDVLMDEDMDSLMQSYCDEQQGDITQEFEHHPVDPYPGDEVVDVLDVHERLDGKFDCVELLVDGTTRMVTLEFNPLKPSCFGNDDIPF